MGTERTPDWGTTTMRDLRRLARPYSDMTSVFEWLKAVGLVPQDVKRMDIRQVVELDPENISVTYLAAAAYEWDTWGESNPDQFLGALSAEVKGAKRDLILETLVSLGREQGISEREESYPLDSLDSKERPRFLEVSPTRHQTLPGLWEGDSSRYLR